MNEVHVWMVDQAAICSIRIDRSQRIERRVRDKVSLRAELTWDDDRRFEAEVLGRSLAKDPAATVEALMKTPHGCEWLMTRWAMLAHAADTQTGWTDEQTKLAFDLLATPHAFREGRKPGVLIDFEGRVIDEGKDSAAVARREVAALKERREVVADLDEVNRTLASSDLVNEGDTELRLLRRYESALHGRLRWCLKQITIQSPYRVPDPSLRPELGRYSTVEDEPETAPKPQGQGRRGQDPGTDPPAARTRAGSLPRRGPGLGPAGLPDPAHGEADPHGRGPRHGEPQEEGRTTPSLRRLGLIGDR